MNYHANKTSFRSSSHGLKNSVEPKRSNAEKNKVAPEDKAAHDWYRFVLSYPPHLVRDYLHQFGADANSLCLDPFCGTGTTPVESKKLSIPSVGIESHPMSHLAAQTKTDWTANPTGLLAHAEDIAGRSLAKLAAQGISDTEKSKVRISDLWHLDEEANGLILKNSISPLPLHKVLVLLETLRETSGSQYHRYELLALAQALVTTIGNLHFGPEVGVGKPKPDARVISAWLQNVRRMSSDLSELRCRSLVQSDVLRGDSRELRTLLKPNSVDVVITSPPYPNEKDYTRTTRLESVLLGLIRTKSELRIVKNGLMRSNSRNIYKGDSDDIWVESHAKIQQIARNIEKRRIELQKTSGFEKMYPKVTTLYFGGMARHLNELKSVLKPGANLAYVVGDQASFLRVMIRTGQILADIAKGQGYEVTGIDLFRTRFSTATGQNLREEAVLLRWPG